MNTILDAALGVAVVFAVFALIVSGLNEAWASFLNKRGKQLFDALNQLMDKKAHELLTSALLTPLTRQPRTWPWAKEPLTESPAVQAPADQPPAEPVEPTAEETEARAKQTRKAAGAYIPSWLFAAAVMDKANVAVTTSTSVTTAPSGGSTAPAVTKTVTIPDNAGDLVGSPLGDVLKKLAQDVENDATQFEAALVK